MHPTLKEGKSVLVSTLPYLFFSPKIGDIIAFKESNSKKILIKRIIKSENGKYSVLGDNSGDSLDSRNFGKIDKNSIIGKVVYSSL